jgi:hypothetical protein
VQNIYHLPNEDWPDTSSINSKCLSFINSSYLDLIIDHPYELEFSYLIRIDQSRHQLERLDHHIKDQSCHCWMELMVKQKEHQNLKGLL